jgi:hypothetical protein
LLSDQPAPKGRAIISAVHGLGGIGKTTVARWLVWRPEIEQRFRDGRIWITLGNDPPDAIELITGCVGRLVPTFNALPTVEAASGYLTSLLQNKSVLFVIDDVWPGKSAQVAKALMVPSTRSRFLLTTRFPELADDPDIRAEDFPLDIMSVDQAVELMIHVLGRKLSTEEEPRAKQLCKIVGGHPLAIELAAARIKEHRPWQALLDDLSAEISRLEALEAMDDDLIAEPLAGETRRRRRSVRASLLLSVRYLNREGQRLFAWLGIVAEEAIIIPKMAATLWCEGEQTADKHLRSLSGLGILNAKASGYDVHDLMHNLARKMLTDPEIAAQAGDTPGFGLTLQIAGQQFLERYRAKTSNNLWHTLPDDGYIHDHIVPHFELAGWDFELENLLWEDSVDGQCGWYQARKRLGQTPSFLVDVDRVWRWADAATANETPCSKAIALQLHCALIITSINSLFERLPVEVLVGAVRCGLLAFPSALALTREHPAPQSRIAILLALQNEFQRMPQLGLLDEALDVARRIEDSRLRATALAEIAERLPAEEQPGVLTEALAVAGGIDDTGSRARALAEVARRLPAEEAVAVARGIDDPRLRASTLAEVAQRMPAKEAVAIARGVDDARLRAKSLAEIAQRLPAEEALAVARGIDPGFWRAKALLAVAKRLPAEEQLAAQDEALSAARAIDDVESRASALAEIAERLPTEERPAVLDEALNAARNIRDAWSRATALAEIAERLPPEMQPGVLGEASSAARVIDEPRFEARALAKVAQRMPADEALTLIRGIDDSSLRAEALAEAARRMPAEKALAVARGIEDATLRDEALAEVARRMPAEEALAIIRDVDDASLRAEALAEAAKRMPANDQRVVLDEALLVARSIDDEYLRAKKLAELAEWLPEEEQRAVLEESLGIARGISDASLRAEALTKAATRMPAEEALAVVRSIDDAHSRTRALAEVAQRLGPGQILKLSMHQWIKTPRELAIQRRRHCVADFGAILPIIQSLGGESAVRSLGRSIAKVGSWWP